MNDFDKMFIVLKSNKSHISSANDAFDRNDILSYAYHRRILLEQAKKQDTVPSNYRKKVYEDMKKEYGSNKELFRKKVVDKYGFYRF